MHKVTGEDKDGVVVMTKIKLPDKGANLERLGRNLRLFTDKKELELNQPITVVVRKFGDDGNNPTK
jgi:predicted ATPase